MKLIKFIWAADYLGRSTLRFFDGLTEERGQFFMACISVKFLKGFGTQLQVAEEKYDGSTLAI